MDLRSLMLGDAFLQANTIKGYRVLDAGGLVLNEFADRFSSVQPAADQIALTDPKDVESPLKAIRVTTGAIWLQYGSRAPWDTLRHEAPQIITRIADMLAVKEFSRQGLRVYLASPIDDIPSAVQTITSFAYNDKRLPWNELGNITSASIDIRIVDEPLNVKVSIQPAKIEETMVLAGRSATVQHLLETRGEFPELALLLDVDLSDERRQPASEIKTHVNRSVRFLGDRLVPFLDPIYKALGQ